MSATPKQVVIAGGGVGALEAVLALRDLVDEAVAIEIIAPAADFVFAPMSVAAPFDRGGAARYPLADFAREQGASLRAEAVASVESEERAVITAGGERVPYDALLIAIGAQPVDAVEGAVMFPGPGSNDDLHAVVADLEAERAGSLAFVVPSGATWALPVYELALLTTAELERREVAGVDVHLVTAEEAPLAIFGGEASTNVGDLLAERGITLHTGVDATAFGSGTLSLENGAAIPVDRAVALRRLRGRGLSGVPADRDGFVPIDVHCRVEGLPAVYAVGDATTFPLKQGGLAAQQADAAVEAIAAELGLHENPEPFRPVLRGQLLTGGRPYYLRAEVAAGDADASQAARAPLWWPPVKVAGKFLAPYLAAKGHGGTPVSESRLVDQQPDPAQAPDVEEVAALAAALATVDVSWVTPTSLRPPRSS